MKWLMVMVILFQDPIKDGTGGAKVVHTLEECHALIHGAIEPANRSAVSELRATCVPINPGDDVLRKIEDTTNELLR